MAWEAAITNVGAALLSEWAKGGTLTIERAAAGTGFVNAEELAQQTQLAQQKHDASIINKKVVDGAAQIKIQIQAQEEAYTVNQVGIFAKLDQGESTMVAIYQNKAGINIPATAEMAEFVFEFYALIKIDNNGNMTVKYDPNAFITNETLLEVEERLNAIADDAEEDMQNLLNRAALPVYRATIPTNGWSLGEDGLQSISVPVEGVKATDTPVADIALSGNKDAQLAALKAWAMIMSCETAEGSVTFKAVEVPETQITVNLKEMR